MANNINCTCGHSWSKASSSKKDMYVCHICGKDNTMKDGGWLDNYGKKPNPNEVDVSMGPGFVGMGNDTTGRDYSPAWGGQFEDGGYVAQGGTAVPTTADSARLFNAQTALNNFYAKEMKAGKLEKRDVDQLLPDDPNLLPGALKRLNKDNLTFYRSQIANRNERKGGIDDRYYKSLFNLSPEQVRDLENKGLGQTKGSSEYQQYYRDLITPMQNLAAPFALIDSRIAPQRRLVYGPKTYDYPGGDVMVYDYDPLAIKPYHMRTDKEKIEWEKKYGKVQPKITSTEKSKPEQKKTQITSSKKTEPIVVNDPKDPKLKTYQDSLNLYNKNKKIYESGILQKSKGLKYESAIKGKPYGEKWYLEEGPSFNIIKKPVQPVEYKKLEEIKSTQPTPKGSKKYIVNGMEVSEEDFLGSGATTGGGKRVIYNTPNKGTQKVLRLDGTPETDPDKIRRALATANKDEMAMGGSLPGAVGFTYARVAGSAPSNGKYAKKTKASAQNGKEMKFYQEGLDFKPNSIAQDGAIVDPMGQWAHPGEVTIIPATDITMEGVDYPVLGISDTGDQQMMYPGEDYNFDGEYVTEYPMMQEGGWLSKYQEKAPSDATRVVAPIRPLTKKEQEENVRVNKQTQKRTEELNKAIVAERKSKRETKGDVNIPGSFNISEKLKLSNVLPVSWAPPGGAVDIFDEYLNPGTVIGPLADSLGESIAARSPEDIAATLAMTLGAGALGFDPLGSALKSPTLKMATKELSDVARTIRDIPRAGSVKEAIGRVGGIPLRKDIPRMATQDVKALRQVQEIGRLRATNSPMADQMKYGLENNLPEEHFQKVFGKSKEEAQNLLNSGFGEQEAAKSANIRSSIDLRRNRGSDLDLDRSIANRPINGQQPGTPEHNALLQEINSYQNPRQSVDRSERINELLQQATQPIADSRYRSLSSDEILNNFNRNYTTETKMTGSMKNFDRKLNDLVYKNIQDYPYYSGEVLQKVPSLNLSGSGSLKDVSKKVGFAPEGISSGDVFTGSTNTSHSSWLPQIKQVFKYDKGTPQFLGYQPMNSLGFLSNYGYDEKDIAKYLNSEIDEQIKRGVIPKNVSRPFQKGEHVMLPQYGVRQNKNGGWLTKYK
jgi:hypothetical protein